MNRALQTVCNASLFTRTLLKSTTGSLPCTGMNYVPCAWIRRHQLTDQQMRLRYKKLHWHKFYDDKWVQRRGGGLVCLNSFLLTKYVCLEFLVGMKKSRQKMRHS